jgi:hypothetical protein
LLAALFPQFGALVAHSFVSARALLNQRQCTVVRERLLTAERCFRFEMRRNAMR